MHNYLVRSSCIVAHGPPTTRPGTGSSILSAAMVGDEDLQALFAIYHMRYSISNKTIDIF